MEVAKAKTSIYVDRELWESFKRYARSRGVEVSRLLEDVIRDELLGEALLRAVSELVSSEDYEVDFEPVEPSGLVSELVRVLRDGRSGSVS
ncbi:hypothetical protein IG193_02020 [Infirmifilum lucidum]|uniref:CopG family transcriptional regulator n=1 Tax=Infirmifilum lucidum TaxID=2776706 RepID=A0A7L9FJS2_9CREN|nr:hypothetical protein [Infirmifilum lucidum]QOJ79263.1 hypothetical protein IG193_02020 [Infirmifilum lucidum]